MLFVNVAELGLLLAAVVLPVLLGMVSALMRRPWWWAAIVAVVVAMVAAIAPTPEPGEARLVAGGRSVPAHPGRRSGWAGVVGVVLDTPLAAPQCRPSWSGVKAELDIVICPEPRTWLKRRWGLQGQDRLGSRGAADRPALHLRHRPALCAE